MQLLGTHHVTSQRLYQGFQQPAASPDPFRHGRAIQLYSFARIDLRLPIQRQVVTIFRNQHMGQKSRARHPAHDRTARCFRLHDLVAARTGQLRPNVPDHFEMFRHPLQHFRDIFPERLQFTATVRASFLLRQNLARLPRQMRRQRLPCTFRRLIHDQTRPSGPQKEQPASAARLASNSSSRNSNCSICRSSFSDLRPNCMRRSLAISSFSRSISSSREASCSSLQVVRLGKKLLVLCDDQCLQCFGV